MSVLEAAASKEFENEPTAAERLQGNRAAEQDRRNKPKLKGNDDDDDDD